MNHESKAFLDANINHYETLTKAGFIQHLTNETRQTFLSIIRENYAPNYICCMHCTADVAKMVEYVYTQYLKEPKEEVKTEPKKRGPKPKK